MSPFENGLLQDMGKEVLVLVTNRGKVVVEVAADLTWAKHSHVLCISRKMYLHVLCIFTLWDVELEMWVTSTVIVCTSIALSNPLS